MPNNALRCKKVNVRYRFLEKNKKFQKKFKKVLTLVNKGIIIGNVVEQIATKKYY